MRGTAAGPKHIEHVTVVLVDVDEGRGALVGVRLLVGVRRFHAHDP